MKHCQKVLSKHMIQIFFLHIFLRNAEMELKFEVIEGALRITGGDGKHENRHH
jgi:hypothetical protein